MERVDGLNKELREEKNVPASGTTTIIFGMEMMFWKVLERRKGRRHDLQRKIFTDRFLSSSFSPLHYLWEWEGKADHEIELEQRLFRGRKIWWREKQKERTKIFVLYLSNPKDGKRKRGGRISFVQNRQEGIENEKMTLLAPFIPSFSHDNVSYLYCIWTSQL